MRPKIKSSVGTIEKFISLLETEISEDFVPRSKIKKISPSFPYGSGTLAERDAAGKGPRDPVRIGGRVFYTKASLLEMVRLDAQGGE